MLAYGLSYTLKTNQSDRHKERKLYLNMSSYFATTTIRNAETDLSDEDGTPLTFVRSMAMTCNDICNGQV